MTEITPDQARQQYIDAMGEELGVVYHALWNEVVILYGNWQEYVELFGTNPSRIELMNRAAGSFFHWLQDRLWDDTLLHIARVTDSPKTAGRENLTIRQLLESVDRDDVTRDVAPSVDRAVQLAGFAKDWRNRRIAHTDLELRLQRAGVKPLEAASRAVVWDALRALSDVLNAISSAYMDSTTAFEGVGRINGAVALLHVVSDGLRFNEERQKHRFSDNWRHYDYDRGI
jgi:hypothetical protein